ncbi:ESX secretion-associated protein EspG [Nocardia camponoti]|uniref:ESX secretion-associated protein EspG n=1 Tax=Nocardia camponoti TaxID=1616106 RepID=A0A917QMV5_9NOCA|nr:ESX secretion-associated protein EspG [Nocardia camponoti]GGK57599.1 hypothetical protein GCM10011591_32210 [Nocardia camponoti]
MTRQWDFTDIEFSVLWERLVGPGMPRPLTFVSEIQDALEFEQREYEAWVRLRDRIDGELQAAIETLARPEVYVRLRGWYDRDSESAAHMIKARAARAGAQGYLVYQRPGRTAWHSSGYSIVECGPYGLAEAIVALMPDVPAGQTGIIPLLSGEARQDNYEPRPSMIFDEADTGVATRHAAFFAIEAERTGLIETLQNQSMFGSRGMERDIIVWRDLPGDGRYGIGLPSNDPVAEPITRKLLAAKVDRSIGRMVERVESHWEASQ